MGELFNFIRVTIFLVSLCMSLSFLSKYEFVFALSCLLTVICILKSWVNEFDDNLTNELTHNSRTSFKCNNGIREKQLINKLSKKIKINNNFIEFIEIKNKDGTKIKTN